RALVEGNRVTVAVGAERVMRAPDEGWIRDVADVEREHAQVPVGDVSPRSVPARAHAVVERRAEAPQPVERPRRKAVRTRAPLAYLHWIPRIRHVDDPEVAARHGIEPLRERRREQRIHVSSTLEQVELVHAAAAVRDAEE